MKIAYKHLIPFLKEKPSIEEISDKLFQLGHENNIIDGIFDIEFTPNRGDCLSVYGLARDLGVFYSINNSLIVNEDVIEPLDIDFINNSVDDCPTISFLNIEIKSEIKEYEPYLQSYFDDLGINKNNFFTDVSNYLAYEIGQPTHCYDYSKIGKSIEFSNIELDNEFSTLLDKKIDLSGKNCIFSTNKKVINLAGVIGDMSTSCNKKTYNALIECAYFRPEAIIGKAVKYDLNSDASYKFERGINPEFQEYALRRFIKIVSDHVNISKLNIYNKNFKEFSVNEVDCNVSEINKILGTSISEDLYYKCLNSLGFNTQENKVKVPLYRHDISHKNDLAEEVARIIGYNNIAEKNFNISDKSKNSPPSKSKFIKDFLIDHGFNEVINAPFCDVKSDFSIEIDNPLDSNRKFLRTKLSGSLIDNLIYNENRQHNSIKLFEIADLYNTEYKAKNEQTLCMIISGIAGENYKDFTKKLDDKYIRDIFNKINISLDADSIQKISRNTLKTKQKSPIYLLEIGVNEISKSIFQYKRKKDRATELSTQYIKVSDFPKSTRDISFSLKNENLVTKLEDILLNYKSKNLKKVFVFDFYKKDEYLVKIGFRFIFQSSLTTLTLDDVDDEMSSILNEALQIKGIEIPGLT